MIHSWFIVIHAAAGVLALPLGCLVLRPTEGRRVVFRAYFVSLTVMTVAVAAAVAWNWNTISTGERVTFTLLTILAFYTLLRGVDARRALRDRAPGWQAGYVDHVGFTIISLFDGFTIVSAIDLGAPLWLVLIVGALGVVVGITAINRVKSNLHRSASVQPVAAAAVALEMER